MIKVDPEQPTSETAVKHGDIIFCANAVLLIARLDNVNETTLFNLTLMNANFLAYIVNSEHIC